MVKENSQRHRLSEVRDMSPVKAWGNYSTHNFRSASRWLTKITPISRGGILHSFWHFQPRSTGSGLSTILKKSKARAASWHLSIYISAQTLLSTEGEWGKSMSRHASALLVWQELQRLRARSKAVAGLESAVTWELPLSTHLVVYRKLCSLSSHRDQVFWYVRLDSQRVGRNQVLESYWPEDWHSNVAPWQPPSRWRTTVAYLRICYVFTPI